MFKLWGKMIKDSRIIKSETFVREEEDTRTHKIFKSIEEMCRLWDISNPIWLEANIKDFKRHDKVRFNSDNFMEDIDFDYIEIQILEE